MTTKFKEMGRLIVMSDCGQVAEIKGFCKTTGEPYSIPVWYKDWKKYTEGTLPATECFLYLNAADLYLVITGSTLPN